MALEIRSEDEIYTILSIPLEWETNKLIAEHLRYLADEIDNEHIRIIDVRISTPINRPYSKPRLEIVTLRIMWRETK